MSKTNWLEIRVMDFWRDHCTQPQEAPLQTMSTSTGK